MIKDKNGNVLTDSEDVLERWREYVKELFEDIRGEVPETNEELNGPEILREEVEQAVKEMKREKAEGGDGVVVEMLEAAGDFGLEKLTMLAHRIYSTGHIPEKMKENIFIAIPKKTGTMECEIHRTISLVSQLGKVIIRIIINELRGRSKKI